MAHLKLPNADGQTSVYHLADASPYPATYTGTFPRTVYAAAHVVADPLGLRDPWNMPAVDWDETLAFRRHLWGLGFAIAEAMDTSQRGMGLDWIGAKELIARSLAEARTISGADLACGVGTDQLTPVDISELDDIIAAYEAQIEHVEAHGGRLILMASRALCHRARHADDYKLVYRHLIDGARRPVILHWLGAMFDPALAGYWGSDDVETAMATVLEIINSAPEKIDGIKISLLERRHEERLRALLPSGVKMYTGDDFNYADLMAGDASHVSHGLLGIFDPIAPAAAAALDRLGAGDRTGYHAILDPTVALSRLIFEAPTPYYKAGVVFLAWLNGFQSHFRMLGGMESARGIVHYADVFRLADAARLFIDPDLAAGRMKTMLAFNGIDD